MNGQELKDILKNEGFKMAEVARRIGITPQSLESKFKTQSVKHEFIEEVARAINRDADYILSRARAASASNNSVAVAGDNNSVVTISERFIALLEKKDEQIEKKDEQISKLLDIIREKGPNSPESGHGPDLIP